VETRRKAVRSLREEDPEVEGSLDSFVIHLAEQIDQLQDAEQAGALDALSEQASAIGEEADRLGYPDFARVVQKICAACGEDEAFSVRDQLLQLTELTRCIRLGHRGAA
jgi:hypothetical protein